MGLFSFVLHSYFIFDLVMELPHESIHAFHHRFVANASSCCSIHLIAFYLYELKKISASFR